MPKRRRVSGIRHHRQTATSVKPNRDHRGIVPAAKICSNHLIEVAHQCALFQVEKVSMHEFTQLLAERRYGRPVSTDVGKRDARHDATGADRNKMNIAARVTLPRRNAMHPRGQAWQLDEARGPLVTGPCFRTGEAPRHR